MRSHGCHDSDVSIKTGFRWLMMHPYILLSDNVFAGGMPDLSRLRSFSES